MSFMTFRGLFSHHRIRTGLATGRVISDTACHGPCWALMFYEKFLLLVGSIVTHHGSSQTMEVLLKNSLHMCGSSKWNDWKPESTKQEVSVPVSQKTDPRSLGSSGLPSMSNVCDTGWHSLEHKYGITSLYVESKPVNLRTMISRGYPRPGVERGLGSCWSKDMKSN